jgi:hypothetical protein
MRKWFFFSRRVDASAVEWVPSADLERELRELLCRIGLRIVAEARGPVPLLAFGRRVVEHLRTRPPVTLARFSDALKKAIVRMDDDRLRVMSPTEFLGVGYVYNARDPETYPVRSGML